MNERGEMFGEKKLADLLCAHRHRSSKEIAELVLEEVEKFNTDNTNSDDKTLVIIRRTA